MNKTVELVTEWARFEERYKEATLEEFCRHYLTSQREKRELGENFRGVIPPRVDAYLSKLIGRINQIMLLYCGIAMKDIPEIKKMEDFYYLNSVEHLGGESRKTDLIAYNFSELSSGIDILNRLQKSGLIEERTDPEDKRSKLVRTTELGKEVLFRCYKQLLKAGDVTFWGMSEEDKKLCIQLLKHVEIKHSRLAYELRLSTIDEIHERVTGVKNRM